MTLIGLLLQFAGLPREFSIHGPFAPETAPPRGSLMLEVPQQSRWWKVLMQPRGDNGENPAQSTLRLRINGREIGPPHSSHEAIRKGETTGFSHWGRDLIFTLPQGVENSADTVATLTYDARPRGWIVFAMAAVCILLWRFLSASPTSRRPRISSVPIKLTHLLLFGMIGLGVVGTTIYVGASVYAMASGWALPTTAIIRWSAIAEWLASNEPFLGYALLTLAGAGKATTWLAPRYSGAEESEGLRRLFVWTLFPLAACAFILCMSANWAGLTRPGGSMISSIGGLNPFIDALAYLAAVHDQAKDGYWNETALYRPLAAAFRSLLGLLGAFSLPLMLILQACLLSAAACFAVSAVAIWRGLWAGVAFFALTYIYARSFVPTVLTEPAGLFWSLLSIPFFIEAFRTRSVRPALVAFAMTAIALMTRMGSMFTLPALLLWLVWQFGQGTLAKLKIAGAAIFILVGVLGCSSLLKNTYGSETQPNSGNFSYVICGLTMGTTWDGCLSKASSEGRPLAQDAGERTTQLYSMAIENFRASPSTLFYRLAYVGGVFFWQIPELVWKGYGFALPEPIWLLRHTITGVCLVGLLFEFARRATGLEITFWVLTWISIAASASLIYMDDGARTLAASYPLIALFLATGMSTLAKAATNPVPLSKSSRYATFALIMTASLFAVAPWINYRISPVRALEAMTRLHRPGEALVLGGRRISGLLVVPDGEELRSDVPSVHFAQFVELLAQSNMEYYQDLIHPTVPPLPFGLVFAPRIEKSIASTTQFIVPPEVLERNDIKSWRFHVSRWGYRPASGFHEWWLYVNKVEPWPEIGADAAK